MTLKRRSFLANLAAGLPGLSLPGAFAEAARAGIKVPADEDRFGKTRSIGANATTFKVAATDTQGALFLMHQHSLQPGGPPLHLHHEQDELWFVISGEYVLQMGPERFTAQAGDCLLGPREIPHAYSFVGPSSEGRLLLGFTPAGKMQQYFERPRTPGAYVADAALYHAFGMELLGPPLSLR
jgi:mannose-6-phosphate isomerase-like protein (cupin superfamily)